MVPHVQTISEIRQTLASLGIRPRKRHGQNFLIDGNLMRRLADAAEIAPGDLALEVGPGTGGLTDLLVAAAGQVIAVEIDPVLAGFLAERFGACAGFQLLRGDALENKNRLSADLIRAVREVSQQIKGRTLLVANLPYNAATPLLMNILLQLPVVTRMCFTVQRDVAEKMEASPGTKAYGPLAVILQAVTACRVIIHVPATAFWPQPQVESTMLRLDVKESPFGADNPGEATLRLAHLAKLVREAFQHRRKTLANSLAFFLDERSYSIAGELVDLSRRPEDLSVGEWTELAERTVDD